MTTTPSNRSASHEVWQRPFVKAHQDWCDDFVLELRLRDVPGPVIGDRLAEVEAHCADTGESPAEAFGDPTDYAMQLDEQSEPDLVSGVWKVVVNSAAQVLALLVGTTAAGAWARGEELSYNAVQVGAIALLVAILLAMPALLRPIVQRPWAVGLPVLGLGAATGAGTAVAGRLDLPALLTLAPAAVTVVLFVVVVALAVAEFRELARDADSDLVTSPLPAPQAPATGDRRRLVALLPSALIPVGYVVLSAVAWVLA
ncbi:hypothetical protein [Georgenia sp. H159]|uniref:hypothetical protein n=1 Tax=Georgenia sp. H159 TaxID=3076115 RepID=UPI002D78A514|nr:hypothetical protein [Georgenia sp. H159]